MDPYKGNPQNTLKMGGGGGGGVVQLVNKSLHPLVSILVTRQSNQAGPPVCWVEGEERLFRARWPWFNIHQQTGLGRPWARGWRAWWMAGRSCWNWGPADDLEPRDWPPRNAVWDIFMLINTGRMGLLQGKSQRNIALNTFDWGASPSPYKLVPGTNSVHMYEQLHQGPGRPPICDPRAPLSLAPLELPFSPPRPGEIWPECLLDLPVHTALLRLPVTLNDSCTVLNQEAGRGRYWGEGVWPRAVWMWCTETQWGGAGQRQNLPFAGSLLSEGCLLASGTRGQRGHGELVGFFHTHMCLFAGAPAVTELLATVKAGHLPDPLCQCIHTHAHTLRLLYLCSPV